MEDIRFYDFEGTLKHIEHDIVSANWTFHYNEAGSFELHYALGSALTAAAAQNQYLLAVQGNKQAVVTGKQFTEEAVLYGRTVNWLLTRFVVPEFFDTETLFADGKLPAKDARTVGEYLVRSAFSNAGGFVIGGDAPDLVFEGTPAADYGEVSLENKAVTPLSDLLTSCMEKAGGGHAMRYDLVNKRWVLEFLKGQSLPLTISEGNRNAYETEYTEELQDYFGGGWFEKPYADMGDWDSKENSPRLTSPNAANYGKKYRVSVGGGRLGGILFEEGKYLIFPDETGTAAQTDSANGYLVHLPSAQTGIYAWETALSGASEAEASEDLKKRGLKKQSSAKTRGLTCWKDYSPGDLVRVEVSKGAFAVAEEKRITGVNIWYENNETGEQPIFEED